MSQYKIESSWLTLVGGVSPPVLGVGFFVVALESLADLEVVGFSLFEEYVGGWDKKWQF
jgi:hypothetical protein